MVGRVITSVWSIRWVACAMIGSALWLSAAEEPATTPTDPAEAPPSLSATQELIEMRYRRFEGTLQQLSEYLRKSDPGRSELLVRAIGKSKEGRIPEQFQQLSKLLKNDQLGDAVERQELVVAELQAMLELLMSEARKDDLEREKKRIQELIKDVNKLIARESDARAETERGGSPAELQNQQKQVSDSTDKLLQKIQSQDAEKKAAKSPPGSKDSPSPPTEGKEEPKDPGQSESDDKPNPDGTQESNGKQKPGSKGGDQKSPKEKPGAKEDDSDPSQDPKSPDKQKPQSPEQAPDKENPEKPEESPDKPSGSESQDSPQQGKSPKQKPKKSRQQPGDPQQGEQQQSPQDEQESSESENDSPQQQQGQQKKSDKTPGREEIERAKQEMDRAIEELKRKNRKNASDKQDKAIAELMKAREKLEEILRQLREEERELVLAQMESRFREMLLKQEAVYNGTVAVDAVAVDKRTDRHTSRAVELARNEEEISLLAAKALTLLKEEGSSIAFPEAVEQIRDDMLTIARRLDRTDVGEITQNIEQDTIESLKEMIEAMQKELEKLKDKKQQPPQQQQQQQQQQQGLVNKLAEMKMLRSLQYRVNRRTRQLGRLVDGEQASDPDVVSQLRQLSERQSKVQKATYDLATGKNE